MYCQELKVLYSTNERRNEKNSNAKTSYNSGTFGF